MKQEYIEPDIKIEALDSIEILAVLVVLLEEVQPATSITAAKTTVLTSPKPR